MATQWTLPLSNAHASLENVGGKGMSLARLVNAGLPVPDGFHVTTAAYRAFVAANGLQARILEAMNGLDTASPAALEAASQQMYTLFTTAPIPREIAEQIVTAYQALTPGPLPDVRRQHLARPGADETLPVPIKQQPLAVAVRSSATAEDLPDASFAGQQETYLNICGPEAVLEATRKCWASLWTARAIGYRARQGIDPGSVALAVVVQELVFADAAGILFTANPVNGKRGETIINAAWGLGEAIVGGMVTPDTLTVEKASGCVLQREIADKERMTVRTASGTEELPVPAEKRQRPVLNDEQAAELARLGTQIELHYAMPMDIEWAWVSAEERFYILQARPITAMPPEPVSWDVPGKGPYIHGGSFLEVLTEPVSPLFATLGVNSADRATYRWLDRFGVADMMAYPMMKVVNGYPYAHIRLRPIPRNIPGFLRLLQEHAHAMDFWQAYVARYRGIAKEAEKVDLHGLSLTALCERAEKLFDAAFDYWMYIGEVIRPIISRENKFTKLYHRLAQAGDPEPQVLLRGQATLPLQADRALYELVTLARRQPQVLQALAQAPEKALQTLAGAPETEEFIQAFQYYLDKFGYQMFSFDPLLPTLGEDPTPALLALQSYLNGQESPDARYERMQQERQQALTRLKARLPAGKYAKLVTLLERAQQVAHAREDMVFENGLAWRPLRQTLLMLGERLAAQGVLRSNEQIFFLEWADIRRSAIELDAGRSAESLAGTAAARQVSWQAQKDLQPPFALPAGAKIPFWLKYATPLPELQEAKGDVIEGFPASPGKITAVARLIASPGEMERLAEGEILVARSTNPAWTAVFARAAAVVTDLGGALSHSSIVAREYGLPAVTGAGIATQRIRDGQTITVDGSRGKVTLHADADAIQWVPPTPTGTYMRGSVVDLLPDPLSPLFITLGISALQTQVIPMGKRAFGEWPYITPDYYTSINNYAYMNAYIPPKMAGWILVGMLPAYPRLLRTIVPMWRDELLPEYRALVNQKRGLDAAQMSEPELWREAQALVNATASYVCGLQFTTMGASAGSEMLLTKLYDKWVHREGDLPATTLLMGWDNIPTRAEKSCYDLAQWAYRQDGLADFLIDTPTQEVCDLLSPDSPVPPILEAFASRFQAHLDQFGHVIFQLDFAEPLPRENPALLLESIKMYLRGEGADPYERQRASQDKRIQTAEIAAARLKGIKRWGFSKALHWAQSLSEVREDALAEIGLAYPLLREVLHELGRRFVAAGMLEGPDDIYWLNKDEIDHLVAGKHLAHPPVGERKALHTRLKQVIPPPMIPVKERVMGIKVDTFIAHDAGTQGGNVLQGIAASPGRVTAPARVLRGPEDFGQMRPGEVLVAGTTTPAWTPLFAMASAVVTDIGGPLSHGSIVAREYGIPAVMGTGAATKRIHSGDTITVDGSRGEVILAGADVGVSAPTEWRLPEPKFVYARASLAEHTPSPATPLFATLGLEIANRATERLWKETLQVKGKSDLYNDHFYQAINGYVYGGFRMTIRELGQILRLSSRQISSMFRNGIPRWQAARERLAAVAAEWEGREPARLTPGGLLDGASLVFDEACRYFTVLQTTLPVATMSELIFTRFYNALIKRKNDPEATVFLLGLDTLPLQAEKALYDLALWARQQPGLETYLVHTPAAELVQALLPGSPADASPFPELSSRFATYQQQYGHTAYEFDFAHPTVSETPEAIFDALKAFLTHTASNPYERQQTARQRSEQARQQIHQRIGWPRKGWFEKLLQWAQESSPLRENTIFEMGMGHPVIRRMLGELGRRFVGGGAIQTPEEIYWLEKGEVEELATRLENGAPLPDLRDRIFVRKTQWQQRQKLTPPTMLPEKSGWARFAHGGEAQQKDGKTVLKGVGTSSGTVTAPACVLLGPEDFAKMKPGDVLVAVTTTPAWTPLFTQASAVVTDIGGPLSHSSIVAREYGIPAVMATRVATRSIRNGQVITVDGSAGTVEM
ncbi:MAG: PEP/pyruvate-binding domain-containing protein [Chloroflexota bacterium]